jgi:putative protease
MAELRVGKVTHYFDKIGVAVLSIEDSSLSIGDKIKIKTNKGDLEQTVQSMQVDHKEIESAETGDEVGLKVDGKVKPGDEVFKLS